MFAEAQVTEDVAKIFTRKMSRFFIYKEYGANYEIMTKDVAAAHRLMPQWDTYQKGLETLAMSLCSSISHENASRKALTIGDLLVKPIQRICRYPLMFGELLKFTPSEDCPNSHMAVEEALIRVREATTEINKAPTDARMKTTLERTWMLQDRLVFSNQATCSPKEELEWKSRLKSRINMNLEWKDAPALNQSSFLDLEIKSLGAIFGKPGTCLPQPAQNEPGETGVSNRVPEESEDADEKTGTDDDVLEMRAGRSGKIKHESPTTAQSDERTSIEPADTTFCSTRKVLGEVEEVEEKASVLVVSNIEEEAHPVKLAKPKAGVVELEKEEDGQGEKEKESGAESPSKDNIKRRISKRWSSSSGRHRESMAHGIRSLFR
ncbi:Phosphatidylinositol 3 4 5-trisphosphate-dependent Rac exchanger 2 protein [Ceratocystis platani]|uniref:Phosphatidylinositol 3 4 5-trisphosphate-dependent Rac exchanger 2 protein n=1 Tax=Ceratocystis fimbriata f. sp. platani TaxID=88771 RepID=A0A0F8BQ56_CERFI|nr:Phosphatidylinositol 3 4 5-trisphosphate-dependent Rac exchanger 2 protein [Ceratocystis platani]